MGLTLRHLGKTIGYTLKVMKCAAEEKRSSSGPIVTKVTKYYTGVKGEWDILHTRKKGTANFIGHILRRNRLLKCVTEGMIERTGRRGRKRKPLFHDPTEKSRDNGNLKRKHLIALSGDLVLKEAKMTTHVVALLHYSVFRKRHRNMKQAVICRRPERDATTQSSYLMTD